MPNQYDRIFKENFRGPTLHLLKKLTGLDIISVEDVPAKIQRTLETELDSLLIVTLRGGYRFIVNIEWQTYNEKIINARMLLYYAIAFLVEKLPVITYVIYIGRDKMDMPDSIEHENLHFRFILVDLSETSAEQFLDSNVPEEIILAILISAKNDQDNRLLIRKILFKLHLLLKGDATTLSRKLAQFEMLGKLKNIQDLIIEEEKNMALVYDMETDIRFMQGKETGMAEGEIKTKMLTAETMLRDGVAIPLIKKYTGLTLKQINTIGRQIK